MPESPTPAPHDRDHGAELQTKLASLRAILREMGSVLVAYSGGLDSAFVLAMAQQELGERAVGLTAISPSLPERERRDATRIASELGARHELVESREIHDPRYAENPDNRCFHCKSELYRITARRSRELGLEHVANGTNLDDLGDYRPGLDAATEASVRSPLLEAGLHKDEVRALAQQLGLSFWDKPAAACLSSRIPYGTGVTPERLSQVERLEDALLSLGLRQVRVRHHGELARIEVPREDLARAFDAREAILEAGRAQGFTFVTLDLAGYKSGSLNQLLPVLQ
ncbi:MAG: ATP-dependent sacrificial sulfur transferase LarE [Myxococcales bacterium]|nr:ATP-dependent sacrificial sulfur transferase LarE [Myxococcales bacterium]